MLDKKNNNPQVHDDLGKNNKYRQLIGFPLVQDPRQNPGQQEARVRQEDPLRRQHKRVLAAMKRATALSVSLVHLFASFCTHVADSVA